MFLQTFFCLVTILSLQSTAQGLTIQSITFDPPMCLFFVLIFGKVSSSVTIWKSIISVTNACWLWAHAATVCAFCVAPITPLGPFPCFKWFQLTGVMECHSKAHQCGEVYAIPRGTADMADMSMSDKRRVHIKHSFVCGQRKIMEASWSKLQSVRHNQDHALLEWIAIWAMWV